MKGRAGYRVPTEQRGGAGHARYKYEHRALPAEHQARGIRGGLGRSKEHRTGQDPVEPPRRLQGQARTECEYVHLHASSCRSRSSSKPTHHAGDEPVISRRLIVIFQCRSGTAVSWARMSRPGRRGRPPALCPGNGTASPRRVVPRASYPRLGRQVKPSRPGSGDDPGDPWRCTSAAPSNPTTSLTTT